MSSFSQGVHGPRDGVADRRLREALDAAHVQAVDLADAGRECGPDVSVRVERSRGLVDHAAFRR
jgi:hypothetical protein